MGARWELHGLVVGIGLVGTAVVHGARDVQDPPVALLWVAAALLSFAAADRAARAADRVLVPLTGMLVALGLVNTYRTQPQLVAYHAAWACAGLAAMLVASRLSASPPRLRAVEPAAAALVAVLTASPWVWSGAARWLGPGLPPSRLPWELASEPVQVALVVWAAVQLQHGTVRPLTALLWASTVALSAARADVGTAAVLAWTGLAMAYCATGKARPVLQLAGVVAGLGVVAYRSFPHLWERVVGWADPWADPAGAGYAVAQALFALGAGGLFGAGPGLGHPELVPGAVGPMALAALGEEWGFAGVAAVLSAYALWVGRTFRICLEAKDPSGRLLAAGAATAVAAQTVLAAGGATGLVPSSDLVLPFVSYGGVALVSHLSILGLVLGLRRQEGER